MITDTKWTQHSLETPVLFPYCFFPTSLRAFKLTSILMLSVFTSVCDSAVHPTIQVQSLQIILQSFLHSISSARPIVKSPKYSFLCFCCHHPLPSHHQLLLRLLAECALISLLPRYSLFSTLKPG